MVWNSVILSLITSVSKRELEDTKQLSTHLNGMGSLKEFNKTLMNKVRCMLISFGLAKGFWVEAVTIVAFLINRFPCISVGFKTPHEL